MGQMVCVKECYEFKNERYSFFVTCDEQKLEIELYVDGEYIVSHDEDCFLRNKIELVVESLSIKNKSKKINSNNCDYIKDLSLDLTDYIQEEEPITTKECGKNKCAYLDCEYLKEFFENQEICGVIVKSFNMM